MTTSVEQQYVVVVNDEDQYSIWMLGSEMPLGWRPLPFQGGREACLEHIEGIWPDIRPKSIRR